MRYVMATDRAEGEGPPPPKRTRVDTPETAAEGQQDSLLGIGKLDTCADVTPPVIFFLSGAVDHHFEPPALPDDWVAVLHVSGATVYLHRPSRVVTLSRPYRVSTSITVRVGIVVELSSHSFPLPLLSPLPSSPLPFFHALHRNTVCTYRASLAWSSGCLAEVKGHSWLRTGSPVLRASRTASPRQVYTQHDQCGELFIEVIL